MTLYIAALLVISEAASHMNSTIADLVRNALLKEFWLVWITCHARRASL